MNYLIVVTNNIEAATDFYDALFQTQQPATNTNATMVDFSLSSVHKINALCAKAL